MRKGEGLINTVGLRVECLFPLVFGMSLKWSCGYVGSGAGIMFHFLL